MPHLFWVRDDFQHAGLRSYSVALMTRIKGVHYATNAPFSRLAGLALRIYLFLRLITQPLDLETKEGNYKQFF